MKCEDIRELLDDYIEGKLAESKSNLVHEHILSCEKCANEKDRLYAIIASLSSMPRKSAPVNFVEQVMTNLPELDNIYAVQTDDTKEEAGILATLASASGMKFAWIGTKKAIQSVSFVRYLPRPMLKIRLGASRKKSLTKSPFALGFRW